jgi:hypothetical protein
MKFDKSLPSENTGAPEAILHSASLPHRTRVKTLPSFPAAQCFRIINATLLPDRTLHENLLTCKTEDPRLVVEVSLLQQQKPLVMSVVAKKMKGRLDFSFDGASSDACKISVHGSCYSLAVRTGLPSFDTLFEIIGHGGGSRPDIRPSFLQEAVNAQSQSRVSELREAMNSDALLQGRRISPEALSKVYSLCEERKFVGQVLYLSLNEFLVVDHERLESKSRYVILREPKKLRVIPLIERCP